jgi:hypothetical protein
MENKEVVLTHFKVISHNLPGKRVGLFNDVLSAVDFNRFKGGESVINV